MAGRNTSSKKNLLLAFDAFGTLFTPKEPIAKQYGDVARKHGLTQFTESELEKAFKNGLSFQTVIQHVPSLYLQSL